MPKAESEVLISGPELVKFWQEVMQINPTQGLFALLWLIGEQIKLAETLPLTESKMTPDRLQGVGKLVSSGELSSTSTKRLLVGLYTAPTIDPFELAKQQHLIQVSDTAELEKVIQTVIAENPQALADYRAGNERALGALVGAAMKATKGQGNPQVLTKLIEERLADG